MKNIFLVLGLLVSFYAISQNSTIKTETFTVKGNCDMCQTRIENAADIKGVKICKWDLDKKVATVTYNTTKTTLEQIQKAIAAKGYDVGELKGDDAAYNKLPACCQYRDRTHEEGKK